MNILASKIPNKIHSSKVKIKIIPQNHHKDNNQNNNNNSKYLTLHIINKIKKITNLTINITISIIIFFQKVEIMNITYTIVKINKL